MESSNITSKKPINSNTKTNEILNLNSTDKIWCSTCNIDVDALYYPKHIVGTAHNMEKNSIKAPQNLHIKPDNIGYRMLVRAGWKYSKGLGAQEQGMRIPIIPKIKHDRLGIGAKKKPSKPVAETKLGKKKVVVQEAKDRQKRIEIMRYLGSQ